MGLKEYFPKIELTELYPYIVITEEESFEFMTFEQAKKWAKEHIEFYRFCMLDKKTSY